LIFNGILRMRQLQTPISYEKDWWKNVSLWLISVLYTNRTKLIYVKIKEVLSQRICMLEKLSFSFSLSFSNFVKFTQICT